MEVWFVPTESPLLGNDEMDCGSSWSSLISLFAPNEVEKINKFIFFIDKKRALLSICLQHAMIRHFLRQNHNSFGSYSIHRTKENKPYVKFDKSIITNWNYNVSHHGKYVAIASHTHYSIGIDIVDITTRSNICHSSSEYINMFAKQLHPSELERIHMEQIEENRYAYFFLFWALKESYVKSIGCGISDNLADICFIIKSDSTVDSTCTINGDAQLILNDTLRDDWLFKFSSIDKSHIVAVALGPTSESRDVEREKDVSLNSILQEKTIQSLLTTEQMARLALSLPVTSPPSDSIGYLISPPSTQSCSSI